MTISWEAGLLLALLLTATLLLGVLIACSRWHARQAVRIAAWEREGERLLADWVDHEPSSGELARLSGLRRPERRAVLACWTRALPDADVRAAARAHEALRRSGLLAGELAHLRHRSAEARAEACRMLGRLGVVETVSPLIERLRDDNPTVRREAIVALGWLRAVDALDHVVQAIEDAEDWGNLPAIMALVRMGRGGAPRIAALLRSSCSLAMTKALLQVTGQLGSAHDPELVLALASHREPEVRIEALRVLGTLGPDAGSVAACLRALDDPEWPARALAAWSLGRLGDPLAVARLREAMGDPAYWVRHHVGEALAALGEPGEAALRGATDDPNPFVRDMAAQALYLRAARAEAA